MAAFDLMCHVVSIKIIFYYIINANDPVQSGNWMQHSTTHQIKSPIITNTRGVVGAMWFA